LKKKFAAGKKARKLQMTVYLAVCLLASSIKTSANGKAENFYDENLFFFFS
jgi:hypothetical protein